MAIRDIFLKPKAMPLPEKQKTAQEIIDEGLVKIPFAALWEEPEPAGGGFLPLLMQGVTLLLVVILLIAKLVGH